MNYLSIIAVILGMISVIITLKYIKYYDTFDNKLSKLNKNCLGNNIPKSLIKIQNELDITDKKMDHLLDQNKNSIIKLLKKSNTQDNKTIETFTNYSYIDSNQRGLSNMQFTGFIKSKKPIKCRIKTYDDVINYSTQKSLELGRDIKNMY